MIIINVNHPFTNSHKLTNSALFLVGAFAFLLKYVLSELSGVDDLSFALEASALGPIEGGNL